MQSRLRLEPAIRKSQILEAAILLAKKVGYQNIKRNHIAKKAGVSENLITWHFASLNNLKRAIMKEAVSREILLIIAQGLISKDPLAVSASQEIKNKVVDLLIQ